MIKLITAVINFIFVSYKHDSHYIGYTINTRLIGGDMIYIGLFISLIFFISIFAITGIQLYKTITYKFPNVNKLLFSGLFSIFIIFPFAFFIVTKVSVVTYSKASISFAYSIMAIIAYLVIFLSLSNIIVYTLRFIKVIDPRKYLKVKFIANIIGLVLVLLLPIYGLFNAKDLQVTKYNIEANLEPTSELNIVLISDIHLGYLIDEQYVSQIVETINDLNPDVVLIAGDVFDGEPQELENPQAVIEELQGIESKYGVYASLGNHDAGPNYQQMVDFVEASDINLLLDQTTIVSNQLIIGGRRDSAPIGQHGQPRTSSLNIPDSNLPVIVIDHRPSNISEYDSRVDLIVSGHTHRGQIYPFSFVTNSIFDVDYGYYRESADSPQVIVTSGVGTWGPPIRVGTNSEVVQITFKY